MDAAGTAKHSIPPKQRLAFVASGGAIKAACFHMGVCLALEERGFVFQGGLRDAAPNVALPDRTFSVYVGSSAGAFFTALLAAGYSLHEIADSFVGSAGGSRLQRIAWHQTFRPVRPRPARYVQGLFDKKTRVRGIEGYLQRAFPGSGLFTSKGIAEYLEDMLPVSNFRDLAPELYITATALDHSRKAIFGPRRADERDGQYYEDRVTIADAAAASVALPPVYRPYHIRGGAYPGYYFDGEIRDTLSTGTAKDVGADLIVSSYTHQPYHFSPAFGSLVKYGVPAIVVQAIYLVIEQKIRVHQRGRQDRERVLQVVDRFFRDHRLDDSLRRLLLDELTLALRHRAGVDYIYLHPDDEPEFFFAEHFDLSRKGVERAVTTAYKHALRQLRPYVFSFDQPVAPPLPQAANA